MPQPPTPKSLSRRAPHLPRLAVATCMAALLSATAGAGQAPSETDRLLDVLVEKRILTEAESRSIRAEVAAEGGAAQTSLPASDLSYEPMATVPDDEPSIRTFPFAVQSKEGTDIFRIRGRLQLDAAAQDFGDGIEDVARQGAPFPDYGVILRRVRLGALGVFRQNWEWQVEVDFAENEVDLANAYLAYVTPVGRLAAGHFKEPFTMEYATSSRYISFIERASPTDAYKVDRQPGVMYETLRPNWYGALGVFGDGIAINRDLQQGWSLAGRLSVAPYLTDDAFVHIGGAINYRRNGENLTPSPIGGNGRYDGEVYKYTDVRLRTREGTRAIDARLIGRDDLVAISDYTRYGLELAAGSGPWWMQGEYVRVDLDVDRDELALILAPANMTTRNSLTQDGWYLQTGYFLTGESKPYRAVSGDFGRLHPVREFARGGGPGAVEVALRYAVADSQQHTRVGRGQKLKAWTAGLNWYLNSEVVLKTNVIYLDGTRDIHNDDGWVYGARLQYLF